MLCTKVCGGSAHSAPVHKSVVHICRAHVRGTLATLCPAVWGRGRAFTALGEAGTQGEVGTAAIRCVFPSQRRLGVAGVWARDSCPRLGEFLGP